MMLTVTVVGVVAAPAILAAAATADLATRRFRLPAVRTAVFLLQYAINDSIEIVAAPVYWIMAGFGSTLDQPKSQRRHERLQQWSLDVLARRAEQLLGLSFDANPDVGDMLRPGPVIVLCRHVNLIDASLPALLCQRLGVQTRGMIMAELLADPGFDLIYGRTGSVFIPRENGPEARAMAARLSEGVDSNTAVVVFPEGRLFRQERLERALSRLAEENPERASRLAPLRHVLPPRPGGVLALLDAIPAADVVVIVHTGLEQFGSFGDLARAVPLGDPIQVFAWRVPAAAIPADDIARIRWLDEQWLRADRHVATRFDEEPVSPQALAVRGEAQEPAHR
jgi:1-acyl-sn-glycerol-3-phosphate acyltransferase